MSDFHLQKKGLLGTEKVKRQFSDKHQICRESVNEELGRSLENSHLQPQCVATSVKKKKRKKKEYFEVNVLLEEYW